APYRGGLTVAAGDVAGRGLADIVVGNDRGPAQVDVFEGLEGRLLTSFSARVPGGRGVQVAVGDLNRDGHADVVTAPLSGRPLIQVFAGASQHLIASDNAFPTTPRGGISVAVGDVNGDRQLDVIAAAADPKGAQVRAFSGLSTTPMLAFQVAGKPFTRGVH